MVRSERAYFPLAEMMAADLALGIHEVMRRPELVVEGFPDLELTVEHHRV
jgi:hypothetical protein